MDTSTLPTRRLFLKAMPAAALVAALPAAAIANATTSGHRAEDLARQLAEVMASPEWLFGEWEITIRSDAADQGLYFHQIGSQAMRRDYRLRQFMASAAAVDPSIAAWCVDYMPDHWSGVRFQCHGVTAEAIENADPADRFGGGRIGFLPHVREFVDLAGRKIGA